MIIDIDTLKKHLEAWRNKRTVFTVRGLPDKNFSPLTSHVSQQTFRNTELDSASQNKILKQVQNDVKDGKSVKKAAFTLAEVLITLGVIGVVAAVTLPTLIANYQKHVTVTQLKKAYTEFSQAMQKAESDHGLMETWDFADFDTAQERLTYFGENYLFPYIKIIKKCIPTSNECWADNVMSLGGRNALSNNGTRGSFVTANGYSVYYWMHGSGTGLVYYVDINGFKAPNIVGKDIFYFQANWGKTSSKQGCYPYGLHFTTPYTRQSLLNGNGFTDSNYACKKANHSTNGLTCAAIIMLDGWKIAPDYPW